MSETYSQMILPPAALASCIAGCIVRDTRKTKLSDADRVNYFPASPMFVVTLVLDGQLNIADRILGLEVLRAQPAAPKIFYTPPQYHPHVSWSPGHIMALSVAFFPDAWQRLGGTLDGTPPIVLEQAMSRLASDTVELNWPEFWSEMTTVWSQRADTNGMTDWAGSHLIKDWTIHLISQLAQTGAGRSLRSAQRRLQLWTGHSKQTLDFFARVDEINRLITADPDATPVEIAADAGFADQSHMGRALKRATGFSPVTLNQKIASEEPFWCYRLLGHRF